MANILYLSFSLVYVFMIGYAWRLTDQKDLQYRFYLLILAALFYDNFVSGIGFAIGAGPFLKFINFFRFAFHAFITPLLCYVVFKIAQKMQVAIAQSVIAEGVVWVMIVAFMISGYMHDIAPMDFVPQVKWGVLNYTHSQSSIPLPVILINVFVLGMAILIWKKIGWPGLFLVSICMFCIAAIPVRKVGLLPGNAGEIILAYGFLLAQKKVLVSST
ncbi:MAG: hypothetical protein GY868_10315 [Deltaproteobacteria bacterium]|nr:hypothetical protein [Deltaproteobacteria bacterium]